MPYITIKAPKRWHQISFDDILSGRLSSIDMMSSSNKQNNTITYYVDEIKKSFLKQYDIDGMINKLSRFNEDTSSFTKDNIENYYDTFYLEKKNKGMTYIFKNIFSSQKGYVECNSGDICRTISEYISPILRNHSIAKDDELKGNAIRKSVSYLNNNGFSISEDKMYEIFKSAFRRIDAPKEDFKAVLRLLKNIFEDDMYAMHHTSAFAYIGDRSPVDAIKKHQYNDSHWFLKIDFSDFFGSTTFEYTMRTLRKIFPFSEIMKSAKGELELEKALSLCFLHGGLPQGTPISPMLTNLIMIPIDHYLANQLRDYAGKPYVYTRYADDILISCKYDFNPKEVMDFVDGALKKFGAPYKFKREKTRYGSRSGRNWNLGIMLNKDNKITIGHQNKQKLRAMLSNYSKDYLNSSYRDLHELQVMSGLISYYKSIESDYVDAVIAKYNIKYGINIKECIEKDISMGRQVSVE